MYYNIKRISKNWLIPVLTISIPLFLFRNLLLPIPLSSGDWLYLYPKAIEQAVPFFAWDPYLNGGMGNSVLDRLWFDVYARLVLEAANFMPWYLFEKVFWFVPFILISFLSSFTLSKKLKIHSPWISSLIYTTNSYILLVISGGQLGIMAAYGVLPFAVTSLLNLIEVQSLNRILVFSLLFAFIAILDLRVGYIFLVVQVVFSVLTLLFSRKNFLKLLTSYIVSGTIVALLHTYWILPILFTKSNPVDNLSEAYTSISAINFFSFAKFEYVVTLLHPNWPENIFGKIEFLRPEFIVIPILAFMGLLKVKNESKNKRTVLLGFALLALIGTFLAKGSNEPFGSLYEFLFQFAPGFVMFRDPTKWYILVALGYSILIPYTLYFIAEKINLRKISTHFTVITVLFIAIWAIILRDATGSITGLFLPKSISSGYQELYKYLSKDNKFYRTLWIPGAPVFGYTSIMNPAVHSNFFFDISSPVELADILNSKDAESLLKDSSIRYVIIPEDTFGKLFLTDRKYDDKLYLETLDKIREIDYLKEVNKFGNTVVFEIDNPKDHFWSALQANVDYKYINPTQYEVEFENATSGSVLVFSEKFDKNWIARSKELEIESTKTKSNLNSFIIPKSGDYNLTVFYKPQKYVNIGILISFSAMVVAFGVLIYYKLKK